MLPLRLGGGSKEGEAVTAAAVVVVVVLTVVLKGGPASGVKLHGWKHTNNTPPPRTKPHQIQRFPI
jgi:hypothetical protein